MLRRFYADNYRCFVNFEFMPERMTLLLGSNGSGKSSVFDVLTGIRTIVLSGTEAAVVFPAFSCTRWQKRSVQRFEIEATVRGTEADDDLAFTYVLEIEHPGRLQAPPSTSVTSRIRHESITCGQSLLFSFSDKTVRIFKDDGTPGFTFPWDGKSSYLPDFVASSDYGRVERVLSWFRDSLFYRPSPEALKRGASVGVLEDVRVGSRTLSISGDNLGAFYRWLAVEQPERAEQLRDVLRTVLPGFRFLRLNSFSDNRQYLAVKMGEGEHEHELLFGQEISDGQVMLIGLYVLLLGHRPPSLIFVDEPDNFVALPEIQPWLVQLSELVQESGVQALVISHHPEVLDYLAPDHPVLFERQEPGIVRVREARVPLDGGLKLSEFVIQGALEGEVSRRGAFHREEPRLDAPGLERLSLG